MVTPLGLILFVIAIVNFSLGPSVPAVAEALRVKPTDLGVLFVSVFTGALLVLLVGDFLGKKLGHSRSVQLSALLFCVASMGVAFGNSLWHFSVGLFLFGAASAYAQVSSFSMVEIAYGSAAARYQNILGAFWAIGAVIGPAASGYLQQMAGWQTIYWAGGSLGLLLVVLTFPYLHKVRIPPVSASANVQGGVLQSSWFWAATLALILYLGTEISVNGWLSTFLRDEKHAPQMWQSAGLSIFWVGITLGRILCSYAVQRIRPTALLSILGAGSSATLFIASQAGHPITSAILFGVSGLFMSGMVPLFISLLAGQPGGAANLNRFFAFGQIGAVALPYTIGVIASKSSFLLSFSLLPILQLAMIACVAAFTRRTRLPAVSGTAPAA